MDSDDEDYMCGWQRVLMKRRQAAEERQIKCKRKPTAEPGEPQPMQTGFMPLQWMQQPACNTCPTGSPSKALRTH